MCLTSLFQTGYAAIVRDNLQDYLLTKLDDGHAAKLVKPLKKGTLIHSILASATLSHL